MTLAKDFATQVDAVLHQMATFQDGNAQPHTISLINEMADMLTHAREIADALGERERIVAWLRDNAAQYVPGCSTQLKVAALANAIERGEHNQGSKP